MSAGNVKVVAYADDRMWRRRSQAGAGKGGGGVFSQAFASEGLCAGGAGQALREMGVPCVEVAPERNNEAFFISRDYIDPTTGTAPNDEEMLETSVLYFE